MSHLGANRLAGQSMSIVWFFDDGLHPIVEVSGPDRSAEAVDYTRLPVSRRALASVAVWLSLAGADSAHTVDDRLVAGARAAASVAADLPSHVQVGFALPDGSTGDQLSFVVRPRP